VALTVRCVLTFRGPCIVIYSVAYQEGGFGVLEPPPEIPKISAESSIA